MATEGAKLAICSRTESKLLETKKLCEEAREHVQKAFVNNPFKRAGDEQ